MPLFDNVFYEIAALLAVAAALGATGLWLRQPLIVSFIVAGILVGPAGLGWVTAADQIDLLAQIGITLLLFVVGLKLDLQLIRTLGPVALATGLGQVLFTSVFGYLIALALGLSPVAALYVAVALTFSSTIIIVKLLSDKREIDALHGRIAVGFLIVQDIAVILAMIGLTALAATDRNQSLGLDVFIMLLKGGAFLGFIGLMMHYVLAPFLDQLARSRELLVLSAIAWATLLAALGSALGFSKEVGAFLAGVSIASTPYREAIGTRLVSLRDFLLLFFFIDLGARLELGMLGAQLGTAVVLSLFVLVGNPIIVMVIMGFMGYRKRTSFLAGLTVAQISEFSLLLGALGVKLGHISSDILGLITVVGLVTIGLSTYMILYSHRLYDLLAPGLSLFERALPYREAAASPVNASLGSTGYDVILIGLGRYGNHLADEFRLQGMRVLGVDFDPLAVKAWQDQGQNALYGDAEDPELPTTLPMEQVRWIISTLAPVEINRILIEALTQHGFGGRIAVTAYHSRDALLLESTGAQLVLMPFRDGAKEAATLMSSVEDHH